jgi:predicted phosphoribosyltransferase
VDTCIALAAEVDEFVCPLQPESFQAVGMHYRHFDQTSDEEVMQALREHRERKRTHQPHAEPLARG